MKTNNLKDKKNIKTDPTTQVNNPQELAQNFPSDQLSPYISSIPAKSNSQKDR